MFNNWPLYLVHHMSTTNPESTNFVEIWWLYLHFCFVKVDKQTHFLERKKTRLVDSGLVVDKQDTKALTKYERPKMKRDACQKCSLFPVGASYEHSYKASYESLIRN